MLSYGLCNVIGSHGGGAVTFTAGTLYRSVGSHVKAINVNTGKTAILTHEFAESIRSLAVSRCNSLLLVVGRNSVSLYNIRLLRLARRVVFKGEVKRAALSKFGNKVAIVVDNTLELWCVLSEDGNILMALQSRHLIGKMSSSCLAWSTDDRLCVGATVDRVLKFVELHDVERKVVRSVNISTAQPLAVHVSKTDAEYVVCILTEKGTIIKVSDLYESADSLDLNLSAVCGAFDETARLVCVGTSASFSICETNDGRIAVQLDNPFSVTEQCLCAFEPSGDLVLLYSPILDEACVWNWRLNVILYKQNDVLHEVAVANLSPNGALLVTGSHAGLVQVWRVSDGQCEASFPKHTARVTDVSFAVRDDTLISSSLDGSVRVYDLNKYKNFRTFISPEVQGFTRAAVDGLEEIVCGATEHSHNILVWSMKSGQLLDVFVGHFSPITSLKICQTSARVISCSWDKTARVWDLNGQNKLVDSLIHSTEITSSSLSNSGKLLATTTSSMQINVWNLQDGTLHGSIHSNTYVNHTDTHGSLIHFIQEDSLLIFLDVNVGVRIYDVATMTFVRCMKLSQSSARITGNRRISESEYHHICSSKDGSVIGVVSSAATYLYDGSSTTPSCSNLRENLSEQIIHRAVSDGRYSDALEAALLLSNAKLFTEALNVFPIGQIAGFARSIDADSSHMLYQMMVHTLRESPHVELILVLLSEVCRPKTNLSPLNTSAIKSLSMRLRALQLSTASLAEKNHAAIDFICSIKSI